jgi:uncharacterized protein YjiS (DUF1127 family)
MPTQQTSLTSETGRDSAGVGFDFSIALANEAMDDVLATTHPTATIAAPGGALSEKDAAEPPATSARSVLSWLKSYWRAFQEQCRRQRLRATLHDLSDRELMDIGVTRAEIDCIAAYRAFDELRDGTAHLWIRSRGVR